MDRDEIDGLFEVLARHVDPPVGLSKKVIEGVYRAEKLRQKKIALIHAFFFSVLSVFAVWFAAGAVEEMARTGFVHIASMLWTDSGIAIANLSDWIMALLETLPLPQLVWSAVLIYAAIIIGARLLREIGIKFPIWRWRSGVPAGVI